MPASQSGPRLTLFSIPKPFAGAAVRIQTNAISSWKQLGDAVDVILVGDDPGTAETAAELDVRHLPGVRTNEQGTPLIGAAFSMVQEASTTPLIAYSNGDVILRSDFVAASQRLYHSDLKTFVGIGRRTDLDIRETLDFSQADTDARLDQLIERDGKPGPVVCKEYFVMTRDAYPSIPDFVVGRGNWDNWMVANARSRGVPVIDLAPSVRAIHQDHDYAHSKSSRMSCYVTGPEAQHNQRLGGGKNIIRGACATWKMTADGPVRKRCPWLFLDFWLDLPRFVRLLADLMRR